MTGKEREEIGKAFISEVDFWKHRKPRVFSDKNVERGVYIPDFMLLLEARRILGRPVQSDEISLLLDDINKLRLKKLARMNDFIK